MLKNRLFWVWEERPALFQGCLWSALYLPPLPPSPFCKCTDNCWRVVPLNNNLRFHGIGRKQNLWPIWCSGREPTACPSRFGAYTLMVDLICVNPCSFCSIFSLCSKCYYYYWTSQIPILSLAHGSVIVQQWFLSLVAACWTGLQSCEPRWNIG